MHTRMCSAKHFRSLEAAVLSSTQQQANNYLLSRFIPTPSPTSSSTHTLPTNKQKPQVPGVLVLLPAATERVQQHLPRLSAAVHHRGPRGGTAAGSGTQAAATQGGGSSTSSRGSSGRGQPPWRPPPHGTRGAPRQPRGRCQGQACRVSGSQAAGGDARW